MKNIKQLAIDVRPWLPLIAQVVILAVPFVLFGLKWGFPMPIFGYPIPVPIPAP